MDRTLREDADAIIASSLKAVLPDEAVRRALAQFRPGRGRVLLVAAGKAAWQMTHAAVEALGRVDGGVVVTKYGHVKGEIPAYKYLTHRAACHISSTVSAVPNAGMFPCPNAALAKILPRG